MKFLPAQTGMEVSSRKGARVVASLLALSFALCAVAARAQKPVTPTAPRPPATTAAPAPARPAAAQATTPTPKAAVAPAAPLPPRQVVTVVHRLSGWKLLAWIATRDASTYQLEELPSPSDVHTNIVAGYISDDGRTVVARLPQAEAELDSFPAPATNLFATAPPAPAAPAPKAEPEYTLITSDGRRAEAKFVGLDAATGLSLLEASSSLVSHAPAGAEGDTEDPTVGQNVRFYMPAPAPRAAVAAPPAAGLIYVNIDERQGRLTEVKSGPSGKLLRLIARTPSAAPEWTGAVVANDLGEVLGIVSRTDSEETQIVPVATVLGARERVMRLRASAPQPWLGVRGEAAFQEPVEKWVGLGWKPEAALPFIQGRGGVFLTKVAPGAPAALAGLKPGDLISRVGAREVRGVEDLSMTLKDAGVGSSLDFTVWRAFETAPLKFTVRLAAALDLGRAFEEAEESHAAEAAGVSPAVTPEAVKAFETANPLRAFGLGGLRVTARGAARLGARGGLLVVAVRPGSYAADCGLRAGDVIETANGADFTLQELRRILADHDTVPVSLGVVRGGVRTNVTFKPSEGSEP